MLRMVVVFFVVLYCSFSAWRSHAEHEAAEQLHVNHAAPPHGLIMLVLFIRTRERSSRVLPSAPPRANKKEKPHLQLASGARELTSHAERVMLSRCGAP